MQYLGGEESDADFRKILRLIVKHGGLGILDPCLSAESAYNTSKADIREPVGYILGGANLIYVGHRTCECGATAGEGEERQHVKMAELDRRKDLMGFQ